MKTFIYIILALITGIFIGLAKQQKTLDTCEAERAKLEAKYLTKLDDDFYRETGGYDGHTNKKNKTTRVSSRDTRK